MSKRSPHVAFLRSDPPVSPLQSKPFRRLLHLAFYPGGSKQATDIQAPPLVRSMPPSFRPSPSPSCHRALPVFPKTPQSKDPLVYSSRFGERRDSSSCSREGTSSPNCEPRKRLPSTTAIFRNHSYSCQPAPKD